MRCQLRYLHEGKVFRLERNAHADNSDIHSHNLNILAVL